MIHIKATLCFVGWHTRRNTPGQYAYHRAWDSLSEIPLQQEQGGGYTKGAPGGGGGSEEMVPLELLTQVDHHDTG